ncbi:MAG: hypothetical protein JNJ60_12710, partial [Rhodocyclaceae bacterium]|nr:hypothetical protein [Rhodocyclaceae bacterium]
MASPSPRHQHSGNTAVTSRRVILAAFGLSLLIHGALALLPGWLLPDDSAFEMPPLRASLRTAPQPATAAPPRQPAVRRAPRPAAQPAENPPQGAAAPATPAGPPEPEPAASEPAARDEAAPANVQAGAPEPAAEPAAPAPVASDLPPEGRLNFAVSRGDGMSDIAESVHGWQHDGIDYVV